MADGSGSESGRFGAPPILVVPVKRTLPRPDPETQAKWKSAGPCGSLRGRKHVAGEIITVRHLPNMEGNCRLRNVAWLSHAKPSVVVKAYRSQEIELA